MLVGLLLLFGVVVVVVVIVIGGVVVVFECGTNESEVVSVGDVGFGERATGAELEYRRDWISHDLGPFEQRVVWIVRIGLNRRCSGGFFSAPQYVGVGGHHS